MAQAVAQCGQAVVLDVQLAQVHQVLQARDGLDFVLAEPQGLERSVRLQALDHLFNIRIKTQSEQIETTEYQVDHIHTITLY